MVNEAAYTEADDDMFVAQSFNGSWEFSAPFLFAYFFFERKYTHFEIIQRSNRKNEKITPFWPKL